MFPLHFSDRVKTKAGVKVPHSTLSAAAAAASALKGKNVCFIILLYLRDYYAFPFLPFFTPFPGKTMLDLESLSFAQGGHFMSNQNCQLPTGSFTLDKKGYHEVHVPALKPSELGVGERLVPIADLPAWAHAAFKGKICWPW